ncbi:MAG TPA: hotdog fold thioesterase [Phnomibacter sp.]|nr:hotdog fold thioesterase [Phnomibacter sp.]
MSDSAASSIWFHPNINPEMLAALGKGNMGEWLGIEFSQIGADFIKGTMPVDHRTVQPFGVLHGGASVVLAETLGSIASSLVVDNSKFYCVGLEVNANHLRPVRSGKVTGTCRPIHLGNTTHVWDIRLHNEQGKLTCICRLTVAILKLEK